MTIKQIKKSVDGYLLLRFISKSYINNLKKLKNNFKNVPRLKNIKLLIELQQQKYC